MPNSQVSVSNKLIAVMVMLVLFSPLAIDIYLPAFPAMADAFHVPVTQIQDSVTWFLFSMGLGQLVAGPLADRLGRKPVALIGIFIYGLSSAVAWQAASYEWLFVARVVQGFGACATSVCAFACVRDSFGPERSGQMISYLNGAICFVPALAPILGAWLTHEFGWQANFSFMLGFAVLVWLLTFILLPETRPVDTLSEGRLLSWQRYAPILKEPVFLYHAILCMLAMGVVLAYVTSAPVWLMETLGLDMASFTYWFGANAVLNIIAAMVAPKCMDRFGTRTTLHLGLLVLMASGLSMWLLRDWKVAEGFMLPILLSSFGFAWVLGSAAGKALSPFGRQAGTAAALLGLVQMSGAGALVSVTQRLGLNAPDLLVVHTLLLVPGLILFWMPAGKRLHKSAVKRT